MKARKLMKARERETDREKVVTENKHESRRVIEEEQNSRR